MSQVWQCDRCCVVSRDGDIDDPPEDWVELLMPVRGSEGARSQMPYTLCRECDDSLYAWLTVFIRPGESAHDGPPIDGTAEATR